MGSAARPGATVGTLLAVVALATVVRLAVLPLAATDGGDAVNRVWIAWRWLSDPSIITHGVWGPLHFYLIGAVLSLFPDPVLAPIMFHFVLGVAAPILMYFLARIEFASHRAAFLVALTFAVYPIAVRNSVSVRAETPFVLFLLAAMIFMALGRRTNGSRVQAMAAGFFMTLAGMLRSEAWLLIPFFAVLLWRKRSQAVLFFAIAIIHPVIWTLGNAIHLGDPFHSLTLPFNWELASMGRSQLDLSETLSSAIYFSILLFRGLTLVVSLACIAGAVLSVVKRESAALWLLPLCALMVAMLAAIVEGSLIPRLNYTASLGTMLLPFSAVFYKWLGVDAASTRRFAFGAFLMVASVLAFSSKAGRDFIGLPKIAGISPTPTISNQGTALLVPDVVVANMPGENSGFISDFYGWGPIRYVALLTRLHPDRIYLAPGHPHLSVPVEEYREPQLIPIAGFKPPTLVEFGDRHPRGVLLLRTHSRFAHAIGFDGAGAAWIGGKRMSLELVAVFPWPDGFSSPSHLNIFRYSISPVVGQPFGLGASEQTADVAFRDQGRGAGVCCGGARDRVESRVGVYDFEGDDMASSRAAELRKSEEWQGVRLTRECQPAYPRIQARA